MSVNEINLDNLEEKQQEGGFVKSNDMNNIENQLLATLNVIQGYKTKIANLKKEIAELKARETKDQYRDFEEMTQDYLDLKQRLRDYPDMIKEQKENIYGLEEYAEQVEEEVELLESLKMQEIQNATDDKGKNKYSNKQARDSALTVWQKENEDYKAAKAALKSAQRDLENAKFDLDRIYNDYKSDQKIADMLTARINSFVG